MSQICALCSLELPKNPLQEDERAFCCSGCLTVFNIIGALENYQSHPLFQEALKAGVIANAAPHLQETVHEEITKCHVQIEGMWCPACAEAIHLILERKKGIQRCVVDYATDLGVVFFNPRILSKEDVLHLIDKLGYKAQEFFSAEKNRLSRALWIRFSIAVFCALNIMMFSYPLYAAHFGISAEGYEPALGWLSFALSVPLLSYCAWPVWKRLKVSIRSHLFGMETLVLLGTTTAFCLSTFNLIEKEYTGLYFDSLSMVLTFVLLGQLLEKRAKFSAKETLLHLTRSIPKKGCKQHANGEWVYVPIKDIVVGDVLLARVGDKIVLDGEVIEGTALVDEAVMTGEALPVLKTENKQVIAGSILKQGSVHYKVTKDAGNSLLGQILSNIEQDLWQKKDSASLVSKITRIFIPTILVCAAFVFLNFGWIRALTLLFIACPCALGIAAPLAESRLFFQFAACGALVRNRSKVSLLGKNPFFVFDKTGTLTDGKFAILQGLDILSQTHRAILKGLVSYSSHPVALSINASLNVLPVHLEAASEVLGRGIEGTYENKRYLLGSARFFRENGLEVQDCPSTVVYFAENNTILSEIHLGETLRDQLPHVEGGILSGDVQPVVEKTAQACGLLWGKGGLDPIQKRQEIVQLKHMQRPIVMVGDGVNDAPAMAAADLGISVVSGTDVAVEVCDILLTSAHLNVLPTLCRLARKAQTIIRQNLFFAFFYNIIGVFLALFGLLNPLCAALAMSLSSLCVTLNSFRLSSKKDE